MKENNLTSFGIAVNSFMKAAKKFDPAVSRAIGYDMMKLVEDDAHKRAMLDLKIEILTAGKELMRQYKSLYEDYYQLQTCSAPSECFQAIANNEKSAYSQMNKLINKVSKITF